MSDAASVRFRVTGRVQGVGFRMWTRDTARAYDVTGWVRNAEDGAVEGVVQGDAGAREAFLAALRDGPPMARVGKVTSEACVGEHYATFEIRR